MNRAKWKFIYLLTILAQVGAIGIAVLVIKYIVDCYATGGTPEPIIAIAGLGAVLIIPVITRPLMNRAIEESEYDDNGMNIKSNSYLKLTRREREELDKQKLADAERVLSSSTIRKLSKPGSKDPEKDMEKLIGLENTKKRMCEMAARMEYDRKNKKTKAMSSRHLMFLGPPGTGKTTAARIMTGFLYRYKYIKYNRCLEIDGNFLVADNPGDSALKTRLILQKAMGGVLFIDEAYSMMNGGQEVIATLIKEMEDKRDKFVLILAGYEDEMKELVRTNPGFKSRIKDYLNFPSYSNEELVEIFKAMAANADFKVSPEAENRLYDRMIAEKKERYFGNARTVRNVLDESIDNHSYNIKCKKIKKDKFKTITGWDVNTKPSVDPF